MNAQVLAQTQHRAPVRPAVAKTLRRAAIDEAAAGQAPSIVQEVLHSAGQPLDARARARLEPLFGQDFSGVRVHTDAQAAASARAVGALAYTVGRDIVFGAGQYAPGSSQGQRMLGHELTHVVQQQADHTQLPQRLTVGPTDDPLEHEAERMASALAASALAASALAAPGQAPFASQRAGGAVIQRQTAGLGLGPRQFDLAPMTISTDSVDLEGSETLSAENRKLAALAKMFKTTEADSPGATIKLSADLSEAAKGGTAKEAEERSRLNRRLFDARDALQALGVARNKITLQAPTAYSTAAHGQISAAICKAPAVPTFILPPTPVPASDKTKPAQPTTSSGLPNLSDLLTLKYGPLTVELPKSAALKLPIPITAAKSLVIDLKAEAPGTFSLSIALDGTEHVRVSAKASVSYDKDKGATGSAGLVIESTRTVCNAANPDELRAKAAKAGDDLKTAMQAFSAEHEADKRLLKAPAVVGALSDMYDVVDKARSGCKAVPAFTIEFGAKGPLGGGTETDPNKRTPGYVGGTVTIPF